MKIPKLNICDELIPTRQSLLSRLKHFDDDESWQDFFQTYWKLIYGVAIRHGLTEFEAQEVVQETIIAVSKHMPDFKYDRSKGSFKAWLLQMTKWRIYDQLRHRRREANMLVPIETATDGTAGVEAIPDPVVVNESVWNEEWDKNLVEAAIQRVKVQVKSKQYQIFDLYVLKKWPTAKITATLGVNFGQVYLAKHRVTTLIKKEIKRLEMRF